MKEKDVLRKEMVLLSIKIENCTCPETKTLLLKRARVLITSSDKTKVNEAKARIARLQAQIPLVYLNNPHGLTIIEERQTGHLKLLPFKHELEEGKRMSNQIQKIATQFNIEVPKSGTKPKAKKQSHTRRHAKDKRLTGTRNLEYSERKFKTLATLNNTVDDKDVSQEVRRQFAQGKKRLIQRETEFNGTRRNDKPGVDTQSWNEEGKKLASARGLKK
ncbi:MAG: hypothetical protein ACRC6V_03135 [Bacteroidales bacterium]